MELYQCIIKPPDGASHQLLLDDVILSQYHKGHPVAMIGQGTFSPYDKFNNNINLNRHLIHVRMKKSHEYDRVKQYKVTAYLWT